MFNFRGVTFHIFFWVEKNEVGMIFKAGFGILYIVGSYTGSPMLQDKLIVAHPPFFWVGGCQVIDDAEEIPIPLLKCRGLWAGKEGHGYPPQKRGTIISAFKGTFDDDFPGVGFSSSLKGSIFNFQSNKSFRQFLVTSPGLSLLLVFQ